MLQILINALRETLYMVLYASLFSVIIGIPFGMFMAAIANSPLALNRSLYKFFVALMQSVKAIPYILVMLLFVPLTNWLISKQISFTSATIVPLTVVGSLVLSQAVLDIFSDLRAKWHNTTKTMGASELQILLHIVLPESYRGILEAITNTAATIVGFSIIAGAFGAGGLGQLAIEKMITEPNYTIASISIVTLIVIQQIFKYTSILFIPPKQLG